MLELLENGRLIEAVLVLVAIEAVTLVFLKRVLGAGPKMLGVLCNLAAGAALMMALRAALTDQGALALSLWMTVALVAHVFDMLERWRTAFAKA